MDNQQVPETRQSNHEDMSRRTAIGRYVIGGVGTALLARDHRVVQAQEATPRTDECVTTAPTMDESGIAFVPLLVGSIIHDMPAGPIEVRISRLAMAPGTTIEPAASPYPALMYIEMGTTACPDGPGRIGYGPNGTIIEETTGEGIQTPRPGRPSTSQPTSRTGRATREAS